MMPIKIVISPGTTIPRQRSRTAPPTASKNPPTDSAQAIKANKKCRITHTSLILIILVLWCQPALADDGPPPREVQIELLRARIAIEQARMAIQQAPVVIQERVDSSVIVAGMIGAALAWLGSRFTFTKRYFRRRVAAQLHRIIRQMATMQEQLDAAVTSITASNSALATDILAINNKITALQAQITANGAATPAMQASLDTLTAQAVTLAANVDQAAAIVTAPVAPAV